MLTQAKRTAVKLFAVAVAAAMALVMATSALAATITIKNTNAGEEYTAYKLFDVSTSTTTTTDEETGETSTTTNYSYTTSDANLYSALSSHGVTFSKSPSTNLWYVTSVDTADLTAYLTSLDDLSSVLGSGKTVTVGEDATSVTIDELDAGYYFVTSTLGSLCILNTTAESVDIEEKNEVPSVEKTVSDADAQIGDTVTFTVEIEVPANTESLTLSDTLSNGLTLNASSFTIVVDEDEEEATTPSVTPTFNNDGTTSFSIDLGDYLTGDDCTIEVTYTATINGNAISTNAAKNEATVNYGNASSTSSTTTTSTHTLTIKKTDGKGNSLNGAEFQLTRDSDDTSVYVVATVDGYRVATAEEIAAAATSGATDTIVVNGSVTIDGLDAETYTLTETKAPAGYNLLTESKTVTVTADNAASITVENQAGSTLPTTGGMGTTIFYIVGGVLVAGAAVLLITRRRMNANK